VEYFPIPELALLETLNVSGCTALTGLYVSNFKLTSLDVRGCTALEWLDCNGNRLTSLDVSGCTALKSLSCEDNQLTSLDVSGLTKLEYLRCDNNQLQAAALNAIFTALSTGTSDPEHGIYYYVRVSGNPGAATCDKTIAQNKGWSVN
jgi:Leucine-rich repeat (LRR) protein